MKKNQPHTTEINYTPEIEKTLTKLVSFRTVTGNHDEMRKLIDWIRSEVAHLPVYITEHDHNGYVSCIITTKKNQKNPKVWLAAHLDVVDASESMWTPRIEEGKMTGRGVFDMKFAAACFIELIKELGDTLPQYDLGIMLTSDEETGGGSGVKSLLEKDGYRGGVVFLPDGGGVWKFSEGAKGGWLFSVKADGVQVHASRPWLGKNAIMHLASFLMEVEEAEKTFWKNNDDHWHLTSVTNAISGGHTIGVVPSNARAVVNVRFTTEEERSRFEDMLNDILVRHPHITMQTMEFKSLYTASRDCMYIQSFARIARAKYGIECGWAREHGSSDARHFAVYDIPAVLIWPKGGDLHAETEWIDLADVERYYQVMKEWVTEISNVPYSNFAFACDIFQT